SCYRTFRGRSSSTASAVVVGCLGYLAGGLLGALGETDDWKQPAYQLVQVGLSMDGEQGVGLAASVRF
ncbi:MAG: hypothetical protein GWN71_28950, partial [Gammaproteobacteria bacterium]|nr:hypothetical protein [Gemmatimonadota bacterium]NIU77435.1 hypothetical protein [Gammaproteobacteria bacterium]